VQLRPASAALRGLSRTAAMPTFPLLSVFVVFLDHLFEERGHFPGSEGKLNSWVIIV
jgi:hypothetical protein